MEAAQALVNHVEGYLQRLAEVHRRWSGWLTASEQAAVAGRPQELLALEPQAHSLFGELQQLTAGRQELLDHAQHLGWVAPDLSSLVELLPARERRGLNESLWLARLQLANLRRLHLAAWVLINQTLHYCNDSLQLLTVGNTPHVYQATPRCDTSGGRLLDTCL